jgi:hypothetical protein
MARGRFEIRNADSAHGDKDRWWWVYEELFEHEKISMEEYARRHPRVFNPNPFYNSRTARRFLITCQDCGEQYEFLERLEPLQNEFYLNL